MVGFRPPALKKHQLVILGLLVAAVVGVGGVFVYVLVGDESAPARPPQPAPGANLTLPTALPPTATLGPPPPVEIRFEARPPVTGFSDCTYYGFKGKFYPGNGSGLKGVQIVVWAENIGLLGLDSPDAAGTYLVEFEGSPEERRLWVQVFENDAPVSEPFPVDIQFDCQNGFQIYQVDWQQQ